MRMWGEPNCKQFRKKFPPRLACGLGHTTALTPRRGVIHYRGAASLPFKIF